MRGLAIGRSAVTCPAAGPARRVALAALAVLAGAGCAGGVRAVFHPSDPAFRPAPGPLPRVYLEADLADLPEGGLRSVGRIEVTVPRRDGIARAARVAAEEGRDLGCWILIEHAAFARLGPRAALAHGAVVVLAHGGAGHVGRSPSPRGSLEAAFDCIVRAGGRGAALAISAPGTRSRSAGRPPGWSSPRCASRARPR